MTRTYNLQEVDVIVEIGDKLEKIISEISNGNTDAKKIESILQRSSNFEEIKKINKCLKTIFEKIKIDKYPIGEYPKINEYYNKNYK